MDKWELKLFLVISSAFLFWNYSLQWLMTITKNLVPRSNSMEAFLEIPKWDLKEHKRKQWGRTILLGTKISYKLYLCDDVQWSWMRFREATVGRDRGISFSRSYRRLVASVYFKVILTILPLPCLWPKGHSPLPPNFQCVLSWLFFPDIFIIIWFNKYTDASNGMEKVV